MTDFYSFIAYVVGPLALVGSAAALVVMLISSILATLWDSFVGRG